MEQFKKWNEDKILKLKILSQKKDVYRSMIIKALDIVQQFIIKKKLILVGGLAIDYALRLKGSSIYSEDELPDFDFMSPSSVDDAYELADILQDNGFEYVGVVRAIHVQTMRIKINFFFVADITFVPIEIFQSLPTVDYNQIRIIHPNYQQMDQLLAFCFPFNSPPIEDIFNRWKKDIQRFNLINKYYPLTIPDKKDYKTYIAKEKILISFNSKKVLIHGFSAFAIYSKIYGTSSFKISFPDLYTIETELPLNEKILLVSDDPESCIKEYEMFYPYMDFKPLTYENEKLVIYSTEGRLLSCKYIMFNNQEIGIVSPMYLLLFFLHKYFLTNNELYLTYYHLMMNMINNSKITIESPFSPSIDTIGESNINFSYIVKVAIIENKVRGKKSDILIGLPENYYPETKTKPKFDYSINMLFKRNAEKL